MAPDYEKAAEKIKDSNPNIMLADFDATTNEAEGVEVQGFPTIKFYPAKDKKNPIDFAEERNYAGIMKFLKEKSTVGWVQPEETQEETKEETKEEKKRRRG